LVKFISTLFFSGYCPIAPGTAGSVVTVVLVWFFVPDKIYFLFPLTLILFIISVWSASEAEKIYGEDGKEIVIDEGVGMLISLLFLPKKFWLFVFSFFLFRFFDIIKLPPAKKFENLKSGWGVTMDDVVAGIYANIVLQIILLII
jgi:phosphatidylglycerophosphatase A